jgi:hypothetical protein
MGRLLGVGPRGEGAGSFVKDSAGGAVESGQPALLGGRQFGRDLESGEIVQRLADFLEAMFQGDGLWREGVGNRPTHRGQGVAYERPLLAVVGDSPSAQ